MSPARARVLVAHALLAAVLVASAPVRGAPSAGPTASQSLAAAPETSSEAVPQREARSEVPRPLILAAGGSLTRAEIEVGRDSEVAWGGQMEFELFAPFHDGASPLVGMSGGLSFHPLEEGARVAMPVSLLFGYRTPFLLGYAGGTFGALFPSGSGLEGGYLFGLLGAAGFDFGPARLLFQVRWESGLLRAGQTQKTLAYGPLVSIGWDVGARSGGPARLRPTPRARGPNPARHHSIRDRGP